MTVAVERLPLARPFAIARGSRTEAIVVVATIASAAGHAGRGECVPYARYGETPESVVSAIASMRAAIEAGASRDELQGLLPAGAARNALDCALWDFEAKRLGARASALAGLHRVPPAVTAFTISLEPLPRRPIGRFSRSSSAAATTRRPSLPCATRRLRPR